MNRHPPLISSFDRARRRRFYRSLARLVRPRGRRRALLPLEEVQRRLRTFEQSYQGVRSIPLARIVGTTDRASDFDRDFLPLRRDIRERWERVERTWPEGDFPPIVVYQLGDAYFVVDGHHRVAVAKQLGVESIDAEVIALHTTWELSPDADIGHIIRMEQERLFMEGSGLDRACPEVRIELRRAPDYLEMLDIVKVHGYHLMMERQKVLAPSEIAVDWYDRVYMPTVEAIRREGLLEACEGATEGDLYLAVHERRRVLSPERGPLSIDEAVREARDEPGPIRSAARKAVRRAKGR